MQPLTFSIKRENITILFKENSLKRISWNALGIGGRTGEMNTLAKDIFRFSIIGLHASLFNRNIQYLRSEFYYVSILTSIRRKKDNQVLTLSDRSYDALNTLVPDAVCRAASAYTVPE